MYHIETEFNVANPILGKDAYIATNLERYWYHEALEADNFLLPGHYDLQFTYSTKMDSTVLAGWHLHERWPEEKLNLLDSVPVVEIKSNIVRLKYRIF